VDSVALAVVSVVLAVDTVVLAAALAATVATNQSAKALVTSVASTPVPKEV